MQRTPMKTPSGNGNNPVDMVVKSSLHSLPLICPGGELEQHINFVICTQHIQLPDGLCPKYTTVDPNQRLSCLADNPFVLPRNAPSTQTGTCGIDAHYNAGTHFCESNYFPTTPAGQTYKICQTGWQLVGVYPYHCVKKTSSQPSQPTQSSSTGGTNGGGSAGTTSTPMTTPMKTGVNTTNPYVTLPYNPNVGCPSGYHVHTNIDTKIDECSRNGNNPVTMVVKSNIHSLPMSEGRAYACPGGEIERSGHLFTCLQHVQSPDGLCPLGTTVDPKQRGP